MENPERSKRYESLLEKHDDAEVADHLENLGLVESDLHGKRTLDIGAEDAAFARWAKRHGSNVTSVDLSLTDKEARRVKTGATPFSIASAVSLPFADESFDLVVSHAAIPNTVSLSPHDAEVPVEEVAARSHQRRQAAVLEAIRVATQTGEIRFAPVIRNERNGMPGRSESMEEVINSLKQDPNLEVIEEILTKDEETGGGIVRDSYRIIIKKKVRRTA